MLAIWNSLRLADKEGICSIAYPPISKEVIGFNAKICAGIIFPTIKKFILERNNNLRNISICLESLPDYKDFENALKNIAECPKIMTS
jgi:O-acetyl-ADP-ribose deacetylase (regulator of RNase III)